MLDARLAMFPSLVFVRQRLYGLRGSINMSLSSVRRLCTYQAVMNSAAKHTRFVSNEKPNVAI